MSEKNTNSKLEVPLISVQVNKLFLDEGNNLKAFATVVIAGHYAIHDIKVYHSEKSGLFVAMPCTTYKKSNGETAYKNTFHAITKEGYIALSEAVLKAYKHKLALEEAEEEYKEVDDIYDIPF